MITLEKFVFPKNSLCLDFGDKIDGSPFNHNGVRVFLFKNPSINYHHCNYKNMLMHYILTEVKSMSTRILDIDYLYLVKEDKPSGGYIIHYDPPKQVVQQMSIGSNPKFYKLEE